MGFIILFYVALWIFNAAVKAYFKDGGKQKCSLVNSEISKTRVILRGEKNEKIKIMSFYDGQWLREGGMFS